MFYIDWLPNRSHSYEFTWKRIHKFWNWNVFSHNFGMCQYKEKCLLKVVIPSFLCREKNMIFSTPRSEYESYDQTFWGKNIPNKFLQIPNVGLHVRWTCGQHTLTKWEKMLNNKKKWWFLESTFFLPFFSDLGNACWPHVRRTCNSTLGAWRKLFDPFLPQTFWS